MKVQKFLHTLVNPKSTVTGGLLGPPRSVEEELFSSGAGLAWPGGEVPRPSKGHNTVDGVDVSVCLVEESS